MLRTENKSFFSNALMYGVGSLLLEAGSIVLLPLYLKHLRPEDFGTLEILNRVGSFVVIGLMANGFRMAALTFYQQAHDIADRRHVTSTVSLALMAAVALGSSVGWIGTPWLARWLGIEDEAILTFGIITVLCESLVIVPLAFMQARIESVRYVSTSLGMFLAKVALTLYFVSMLDLGIWGVLVARIIVAVFCGILLNALELHRASQSIDWKVLKAVINFALPFLPGGFLAFFINNGDRFYLIRQAGEYEVGIYSLSYKLAGMITLVGFIPLYKVWSSKMYRAAELYDAPAVFGIMFTRMMASLTATGLAAALFSEDLLLLIGGRQYISAIRYLPPLLAATVLMSAADLMDSGFYVTRTTKYKPGIFFVTAVVIFFFYSLLIPRYTSFGAAWATLIAFFVHVILTWFLTQQVFPVAYEWRRIIALAGSAISCWALSTAVVPNEYRLQLNLILFVAWSAFIGYIATREERRMAVNSIKTVLRRLRVLPAIDSRDMPCGPEQA